MPGYPVLRACAYLVLLQYICFGTGHFMKGVFEFFLGNTFRYCVETALCYFLAKNSPIFQKNTFVFQEALLSNNLFVNVISTLLFNRTFHNYNFLLCL